MELEPLNNKPKRGPRVTKACDYCRDKKLKCNGSTPCTRCFKLKLDCSYNYIEKRRAPRSFKKKPVDSSILPSVLESPNDEGFDIVEEDQSNVSVRLDRIESMLTSLMTQLGHDPNINNLKKSNQFNSNDEGMLRQISPESTNASPDEQNYNGQYFGSQSSFSIFSPKGLTYITNRLNNKSSMDKMMKMFKEVHYVLYQQYKERVEPASPNQIVKLPERKLCNELVESFVNGRIYQNGIINEAEIMERLDVYFENEYSLHRKELKQSDNAMLHVVIALGALGKLENYHILNNSAGSKSLTPEEIEFFRQVEEKHIISALYYFHRLTVFSDGVNGIRSILLLISYFESSLIPDMEYLLISSIIRFSQSIGLHRKESLIGISEREALLRQRIWLSCYVFDKDLCVKSGKPLIINDLDVSSLDIDNGFLFDVEKKSILKLGILEKNFDLLNNQGHFKEFLINLSSLHEFGVTRYFEILKLKTAKISSQVYFSLFSATALDGKTKKDVMGIVQTLNDSFYLLKESIPKFIRPGYKISIPSLNNNNELTKTLIYSNVVKFQLSYHLNVMNVNKIGLNKKWRDGGVSANLCLESAREIIRISQSIKLDDSQLYLCSLFIILSANVTLISYILENTRDFESIKSDLILMSKTTDLKRLRFIELQYDPINTMKFLSITFTVKNFIKIGVDFYNQQLNKNNNKEEMIIGDHLNIFEIQNNEKDLLILEYEMDKCLKLIQNKYGYANFIKSTIGKDPNPIDKLLTNIQNTEVIEGLGSNNHIQNGSILQHSQIDNSSSSQSNDLLNVDQFNNKTSYILNTSPQNSIINNNSNNGNNTQQSTVPNIVNVLTGFDPTNVDDLVLNSELLDMSYFSQPIFNIPNFMMDETP